MILIMSIILFILSLCMLAVAIGFALSSYWDYKKRKKQIKRDEETRPLYFCDAVSGIMVPAEFANKVVGSIRRKT